MRYLFGCGKLCVGVLASVICSASASAGLLADWEFDAADVSGSTVSATAGTAANTAGTLIGDASTADGFLALGSSTNYLAFGTNVSDLRGLGAITICAWVRAADSATTLRRIVEHDDNYYFYQDSGKYRFVIHGAGGASLTSTTAPASNVWQHVAAVWQLNNTAKIYVNGVLEQTVNNPTVAMPNNAQRLSFGAQRNNSATPTLSAFYKGDMDDVAVWNTALSATHIAALAGTRAGGYAGRLAPTALGGLVAIARATNIGKTNATLNALLNDAASSARIYWGPSDGGTDPVAWSNVCDFGASAFAAGLSTNLTGLAAGTRYRYRLCADGQWTGVQTFATYATLPDDLAGLQLWLRPDVGVTTNATGVIDALADQSGNARNAARSGSSGTLRLEAAGIGGLPAARFAGGDNNAFLSVASYTPAAADDLTVFAVARALPQTDTGTIRPLVSAGTQQNGQGLFCIAGTRPWTDLGKTIPSTGALGVFGRSYASSVPYSELAATNAVPNFAPGAGHVAAVTLDAAANSGKGQFAAFFDGFTRATVAGQTTSPVLGSVEIGGSSTISSYRFDGFIGDVLIYNRVLSADERNRIGWYLQSRYGLEGAYTDPLLAQVAVRAATAVTKTTATLNGDVLVVPSPVNVTFFWGEADGGTDPAAWAHTNALGTVAETGHVSASIAGLAPGTTYRFCLRCENDIGETWTTVRTFTTWREEPSDFAGLQLWLKADEGVYSDSGTTPATNGAVVAQWNDASGNARDAARIGTLGNVTCERDSLGEMPVIRMTDASGGDYLRVTNSYEVADTNDLTVFVVSRAAPQTVNGSAIHPLVTSGNPGNGAGAFAISTMRPNAGGPGNLGYFGRNYNPFPYDEYTKTNDTPNFSDQKGHVIVLQLAGASSGGVGTFTGFYDGETKEVHAGLTSNPLNGPVEIGGSSSGTDRRYAGAFGDILIYNRVLTDKERNKVGWHLQTKYGLEGNYVNPYAVVITNAAATDVLETSATCNAELLDGDVPATVTLYWGQADGGADAGAWAHTNALGEVTSLGAVSANLTGLVPGAIYYYRFHASNSQGGVWTDTTISFVTDGPPIITTDVPNALAFTSAALEGTLVATSGAPTQVWVYWGTADGGTNESAWNPPIILGIRDVGVLSTNLTGLAENTTYYYRYYAANAYGGRWASATQGFKTPFTENIAKAGNLVLWLRADVGVTHSSGLVDVWQDQATALGGANSAAGEGASRPLWVLDGIGGRPAVRFDGNNDLLSIPDHDALDLGTGAGKGWTVVSVYRRTSTSTVFQDIVAKTGGTSATTDWRLFTQNGGLIWGTGVSTNPAAWMSAPEPSSASAHVIAGTLIQTGETSGHKVLYVDGSAVASGDYADKSPLNDLPVTIGGVSAASGNLQGLVAEILVYNRMLSDDDLNNVGWYLQEKYGISGAFEYRPPHGTVILLK